MHLSRHVDFTEQRDSNENKFCNSKKWKIVNINSNKLSLRGWCVLFWWWHFISGDEAEERNFYEVSSSYEFANAGLVVPAECGIFCWRCDSMKHRESSFLDLCLLFSFTKYECFEERTHLSTEQQNRHGTRCEKSEFDSPRARHTHVLDLCARACTYGKFQTFFHSETKEKFCTYAWSVSGVPWASPWQTQDQFRCSIVQLLDCRS